MLGVFLNVVVCNNMEIVKSYNAIAGSASSKDVRLYEKYCKISGDGVAALP